MGDWEAHNLLQGTGSKMQDLRNSRPLDLTACSCLYSESEILHVGRCVLKKMKKRYIHTL